jgi:GNAT superfamily N-acetyltransferase
MDELDRATVVAAVAAWVMTPAGSEVVETDDYRMVCLPERFTHRLQVQWVRSARPAEEVLADMTERAAGFGQPRMSVTVGLGAPGGLDRALLARGAECTDTCDMLARALPADIPVTGAPGIEMRWRTSLDISRDLDRVGISVFGGRGASDEVIARRTAVDRENIAAGAGGAIVAYADGEPVALGGVQVVDGVARLYGGGVLEAYRSRGVYRALLAERLTYAVEHGATMTLTRGRVTTSSPILKRLGFVSYGQEHVFRLPLD